MVAMMGWGVRDQQGWRKGPWTPEEDKLLSEYVKLHGEGRWSSVARCAGLNRSGKSCRLRWVNYLRPGLKKGQITPQEEGIIIELHALWGNKWSTIARYLPGRTDNEIKNYWRTHFKKKDKSSKQEERKARILKQQQQGEEQEEDESKRVDTINGNMQAEAQEGKQEMMCNFMNPTMEDPWCPTLCQDVASWADSVVEECGLWGSLWNLEDNNNLQSQVNQRNNCNKIALQNQATTAFSYGGDPNNVYNRGYIF